MWDRKKVSHGTPIDGRYLALAGKMMNLRGTSLVSDEEAKRRKMKRVTIVLTILFAFAVSAFAGMGARQGGGLMISDKWWGMNSVWFFMVISVVFVVYGVFSILKRE
jgi:preprotein translocase subunit SecY